MSSDLFENAANFAYPLECAGLEPKSLPLDDVRVVFDKVMPAELEVRGVGVDARRGHRSRANLDDVFLRLSSD